MRAVFIPLSFVIASVGCTPGGEATDFQYRATLARQTSGLELHFDGEQGHAGMLGTNCPFDTRTGMVTGDYDLPGRDEIIQDAEPTVLGEITIAAVVDDDVHVLDKTDGVYTHVPVSAPGVREARLLTDGVVTLHDDCTVQTRTLDGDVTEVTPVAVCEGADFEVDPATGIAFVAAGPDGVLLGADGPVAVPDADLVSWDPATDAFYTARRGGTVLEALEADGTVRWSVQTAGPIHAIDDAGEAHGVAVVMEQPSGRGWIALHDGTTGAENKRGETPSAADALSVSGNGEVIALVRADQTYFYDIL
jgi:hypothetical protein